MILRIFATPDIRQERLTPATNLPIFKKRFDVDIQDRISYFEMFVSNNTNELIRDSKTLTDQLNLKWCHKNSQAFCLASVWCFFNVTVICKLSEL